MRIEYSNHTLLPGGSLALWVYEWPDKRGGLPREASYVFQRDVRRWFDSNKEVILDYDPRHMRLLELVIAQGIQSEIDRYVGL